MHNGKARRRAAPCRGGAGRLSFCGDRNACLLMPEERLGRGPSVRGIPAGDNRVGERVLLCRRAIPPRQGFWTLPAGYLELGEAAASGAEREAWEEARARIRIEGLLAVYDIPHISQVQLIYRARLLDPE